MTFLQYFSRDRFLSRLDFVGLLIFQAIPMIVLIPFIKNLENSIVAFLLILSLCFISGIRLFGAFGPTDKTHPIALNPRTDISLCFFLILMFFSMFRFQSWLTSLEQVTWGLSLAYLFFIFPLVVTTPRRMEILINFIITTGIVIGEVWILSLSFFLSAGHIELPTISYRNIIAHCL